MGVIQIVAGALRSELLMKFVSRSVMTGFVNALAILIFLAQWTHVGCYAVVAAGLAIIYLFPCVTNGWSVAATFEGEFSNVTRSYAGKGVVRHSW